MIKKKIIPILLVIVMILSLCGCHGRRGNQEFVIPEQFDESKMIEITFWAKNDTNKAQTEVYEKAIRDFENYYPNIKVNMKLYTDYSRIYNDVITNISTGTTPNVCITYPDHIATYLTGDNIVIPLDQLFTDEHYGLGGDMLKYDGPDRDEMIGKYLEECKLGQNYYAIPYMRSSEACYINKTLVEKLGYEVPDIVTWDFVFEVSEKAMEKNEDGTFKVNGQNVLIPFIYKSTDNMMIQMLKQKNADYSDSDGNILMFNETTTDILKEISVHGKSGSFSTFKISSYPGNFLNAGQCIFAVDSTAGSTWIGADAPLSDIEESKRIDDEIVIRPVPQYDTGNVYMISQGPSICLFNKADNQEVLASWLFAQYLLTNDVQIGYARTEGYIPVTLKAQNSSEYQDYLSREGEDNKEYYSLKIQVTKMLMENIENTFVTPVFPGSSSLRMAAGQVVENVTKSVRRKETVNNEYFEKMYQEVISMYHLDQNNSTESEKNTGSLSTTVKVLFAGLIISWASMLVYIMVKVLKKREKHD